MRIGDCLLRQVKSDLGINVRYIKGQNIQVRNCWFFSTKGDDVEALFYDVEDFKNGINRIYKLSLKYQVLILAFVLMDTHVHFVLYGDFDECQDFIHEYTRETSIYLAHYHNLRHALAGLEINYQKIDTDSYLKNAICYTVKNPPVGGLPFVVCDYPWSSGPLYFRKSGLWTSPKWDDSQLMRIGDLCEREKRDLLKSRELTVKDDCRIIDGMVFPAEFVPVEVVEMVFGTQKAYNYFMCRSRESDVDERGNIISNLSIPIQELRQLRNELCREQYGCETIRKLSTAKRIKLARVLKARYNSSSKQIAKLCGLVYDEVKGLV